MNKKRMLKFVVPFALAASQVVSAQEYDNCRDVLVYSARNYSVEDSQLGLLVNLHDQFCDNSTEKSGQNFDSSLSIMVKAMPLGGKLSGSTSQEKVASFCKNFDAEYRRNESHYKATSEAVAETTRAWLACEDQAKHGVLFHPEVKPTLFALGIARKDVTEVSVKGITYDHTLLTCTVPSADGSTTRTDADDKTTFALTAQYWSVTCRRTSKTNKDETYYPQADISVETTAASPFTYTIPAAAQFPYQFAADLQKQLDVLNGRVTDQEKRHYGIEWGTEGTLDVGPPTGPTGDKVKELGKHDICQLTNISHHIISNAMSLCKLTQEPDGSWSLIAHHDNFGGAGGSYTVCEAKCGTIH
jgi:hypothetical protein